VPVVGVAGTFLLTPLFSHNQSIALGEVCIVYTHLNVYSFEFSSYANVLCVWPPFVAAVTGRNDRVPRPHLRRKRRVRDAYIRPRAPELGRIIRHQ
jgi:hypothetical protein